MLPEDAGTTSQGRTAADNATVRSVFVIGPDKKVKAMLTYPMSTGRNFDEVLRAPRLLPAHREAQGGHAGELEAGRGRDHRPGGVGRRRQADVPGRLEVAEAVHPDRSPAEVAGSSLAGGARQRRRRRVAPAVPPLPRPRHILPRHGWNDRSAHAPRPPLGECDFAGRGIAHDGGDDVATLEGRSRVGPRAYALDDAAGREDDARARAARWSVRCHQSRASEAWSCASSQAASWPWFWRSPYRLRLRPKEPLPRAEARQGIGARPLHVDLRVPVGAALPEVADFIARCEDAGLDGVGVHDHPHRGRDVFVALALAAARTRRLRLYPATSSPVVRHPLLLASAAHSLEEVAPGRILLTVAPGFLAARAIGRARGSVALMREAVTALRRLLAGESAVFDGQTSRLLNTSRPPTPVYLLAAGPRMVELAGEVADGAVLMVGLHPEAIRAARRHLAEGARRAGRSLGGFPVIFIVTLALADRVEHARRWPQRWFAPGQSFLTYPSAANLYWLRHAGIDLGDDHDPAGLSDETAARACDAFGLFGPPEYCRDRLLRAREESGVEHVFFFPAHTLEGGGDLPIREVEAFARVIRPALPA